MQNGFWNILATVLALIATAFAFFVRRDLSKIDTLEQRLNEDYVSKPDLRETLRILEKQRQEDRVNDQRLADLQMDTLREIKGSMERGLEHLEEKIDGNQRITSKSRQRLANYVHQLALSIAAKTGVTIAVPPEADDD